MNVLTLSNKQPSVSPGREKSDRNDTETSFNKSLDKIPLKLQDMVNSCEPVIEIDEDIGSNYKKKNLTSMNVYGLQTSSD